MTLSAGVDYLMTGRVTVGNGNGQLETNGDGTLDDGSAVQAATLTIEAGVEVFGETGTFANLLITRVAKSWRWARPTRLLCSLPTMPATTAPVSGAFDHPRLRAP